MASGWNRIEDRALTQGTHRSKVYIRMRVSDALFNDPATLGVMKVY